MIEPPQTETQGDARRVRRRDDRDRRGGAADVGRPSSRKRRTARWLAFSTRARNVTRQPRLRWVGWLTLVPRVRVAFHSALRAGKKAPVAKPRAAASTMKTEAWVDQGSPRSPTTNCGVRTIENSGDIETFCQTDATTVRAGEHLSLVFRAIEAGSAFYIRIEVADRRHHPRAGPPRFARPACRRARRRPRSYASDVRRVPDRVSSSITSGQEARPCPPRPR